MKFPEIRSVTAALIQVKWRGEDDRGNTHFLRLWERAWSDKFNCKTAQVFPHNYLAQTVSFFRTVYSLISLRDGYMKMWPAKKTSDHGKVFSGYEQKRKFLDIQTFSFSNRAVLWRYSVTLEHLVWHDFCSAFWYKIYQYDENLLVSSRRTWV